MFHYVCVCVCNDDRESLDSQTFIIKAEQVKIRLHGSRKKGTLVEPDIFASNGIIHLVDKLMDAVPSTVISDKEVGESEGFLGHLHYINVIH